ncbi:MAG: ethanolamine ammonia-lyase subunit EutC [Opitutaceae bacterium]|nr:ethanolamine ammonia-lyase subunit EutC [Opitutaceae bacterium]
MSAPDSSLATRVQTDLWQHLKRFTPARIALGRAGGSLPTREILDFRASHALARDAVQAKFNAAGVAADLAGHSVPTIQVATQARSRAEFLQRPDRGRMLATGEEERLSRVPRPVDLVIVVSDGLSALAAHRHAVATLLPLWRAVQVLGWKVAPVVIAPFARVKLQDAVGEAMVASFAVMLLGERPGLGTPDSLGAYLIASPTAGCTDADRNCLSNIRPEGLPPYAAAEKLLWLMQQSRATGRRGIHLKDTMAAASLRAAVGRDETKADELGHPPVSPGAAGTQAP